VAVLTVLVLVACGFVVKTNLGDTDDDRKGTNPRTEQSTAAAGRTPTGGPSAGAVPANWTGRWGGAFKQGNSSYTLDLTLKDGKVNAVVGEAAYAPLGCSGIWTLISVKDGELRAKETITNDPDRACTATVPVSVKSMDGDRLLVQLYSSMSFTGEPLATGILTRR